MEWNEYIVIEIIERICNKKRLNILDIVKMIGIAELNNV